MTVLQEMEKFVLDNPDSEDVGIMKVFIECEKRNEALIAEYRELHPEHKSSTLYLGATVTEDDYLTGGVDIHPI